MVERTGCAGLLLVVACAPSQAPSTDGPSAFRCEDTVDSWRQPFVVASRWTSVEREAASEARSAGWAPRARVRVGAVYGASPEVARGIRKTVRGLRVGLRACHERSPSFDRASQYRVVVDLRGVRGVQMCEGSVLAPDVHACISSTLADASWPRRPPGSRVGFALHLSAQ